MKLFQEKLKLFYLIFIYILRQTLTLQILPYGRKPIELSVNNAGEISSYIFQFITQTDLLSGDGILIQFPVQISINAGLLTGNYVSGLTFNTVSQQWESLIGPLSINYVNTAGLFVITVPDMKAGIYKIQINNIQNPAAQVGTGMFSIQTRRFASYQLNYNLLDDNNAFGQVGIISPAPTTLVINSVTLSSQFINTISNYNIQFTTTIAVPIGGSIVVSFANTAMQFQTNSVFTSSIAGAVLTPVNNNQLIITSSSIIPASAITVTITNVLNPVSKGLTNILKVQSWINGANTILEQNTQNLETQLNPGAINQIQLQAFSLMFVNAPAYPFIQGELVQHELAFITTNPVPKGGVIVIQYFLNVASPPQRFILRVVSGLQDISSTNQVSISSTTNIITISNFQAISGQKLIKIAFEVNNGNTSPLTSYQITTYYDSLQTQKIDQATSATNPQTLTIKSSTVSVSSPPNFTNQLAGATNTVQFSITTQICAACDLWVWFPQGFTIDRTNCKITSPSTYNCQTAVSNGYSNIAIITPGVLVSTPITVSINVQNILSSYANYPIGVSIVATGTTNIQNHSTMYNTQTPPGILPVTANFNIVQLSYDCQQNSMMKFYFKASQNLPQSQWLSDYTQQTSRVVITFPIVDGTGAAAFANDLGLTSLSYSLSNFPCYGIQSMLPIQLNGDLLCQVTSSTASATPVTVQITNYGQITANSQVEFHFPNFKNPSMTNSALTIKIQIYVTNYRLEQLIFQDTTTIPVCQPSTASQNPNNPSNPAPIFNPAGVSQMSTTSIFYTPGVNKGLITGDYLVFIFPQLQNTTPMQYILPRNGLSCYIGVGSTVKIPCKTYPKAGWVLFFVNSNILQQQQITFYFTGITNPSFASDFQGTLQILSIKGTTQMIIEIGIFASFTPFNSGSLASAKITCQYFESLRTNVNFDFLFSFQHDLPDNGSIDLIFPPNFFDLSRSTLADPNIPTAQIQVFFGISSIDGQPLTSSSHYQINVNIYTILGIKKVPANTLIYVRMLHIRNPPIQGITNFFGIKSKTQEGLTIDYNRSVRTLNILRKLPTGIINFNYFTVTPDNGNPSNPAANEVSNFPGTYTVSFYPNYDVPPLGIIQLQFPNDFGPSFFLDAPNIRCQVSGAISTFMSCTMDTTQTAAIVKIKLDDYLYVVDGMQPVIISIPHVKNIGPQLSTGVVVVSTQYDQVTLDESGTTTTNRKATTGVSAQVLKVKNFSYSPLNEGQIATYTIQLYPNYNFDSNTSILFEFSYDYSSELGQSVQCQSADLQISANNPIQCTVGNWQILMSNLKSFTSTSSTVITINLIGIINPSSGKSPNIKCFIMQTKTHAYSYSQNVAASATQTLPAPSILFMQNLNIGSSFTRTMADYQFFLLLGTATTFDITSIQLQSGYDLSDLWVAKSLTYSPAGTTPISVTPIGNTVQINQNTVASANQQITIKMSQIPNPYDQGVQPGYPTVSLYNSGTLQVVQQTFNNLNNFLTPVFTHNGPLITVNNDNPQIQLQTGVWSSAITVSIASAITQNLQISPIISPSFSSVIQFTPIIIKAGQLSTTFQIGISNQISIQQLFVQWDKTGAPSNFINVRPVTLIFSNQNSVLIQVDNIGSVPSGGRSNPIKVLLTNAPFSNLYVNVRILGTIPMYLTVYPQQLTFNTQNQVGYFWVSVGPYTQGTSGQVIFFLTADGSVSQQLITISTFKLINRVQNFIISKPDSTSPLIYNANHVIKSDGFDFTIQVSSPCTIYIFAAKLASKRISLPQLKAKIYPTDYFASPYVMAEYTTYTASNSYSFTISGLPSGFDFVAHVYVEDYNGNQSGTQLDFTDRTLGGSAANSPTSKKSSDLQWATNATDTVMGQISSTWAYITNLGLLFSGQIYAVALTSTRYTYPNLEQPVAGSIRYLQSSSPLHTCTGMTLNPLSIQCTLNGQSTPDNTRSDYITFGSPSQPTGYQIYQGLDQDNLYPNAAASAYFPAEITWILQLKNLQPNTKYTVYYIGVYTEGNNYTLMDDSNIRSITFTTASSELASNCSALLNYLSIITITAFLIYLI
ncbi:hypothetical protein TTHERM_01002750 (macronuclear) [Tetrahymena thermophila SB210]|uniref:Uncharacterized protein n=1 Tax=Tetrahymena thermophila (strain SB210) TaxID=312017 RepID=Q22D43_TETTS|nr:hypothetical protein TTHERM_01002750 [Tetrahymena thermophila SB210]EAR83210.3 hypothetical protein TTHERM_01002750 [Tetrahymena thermophila SB210]|eukprot:XP_001030873.3 hypothetical protein TTHERM_01002750 [Tetrahymena thermophila SB210]